ncbi:hypothetical protein CR513_06973, partial [Mucuna pruriens]
MTRSNLDKLHTYDLEIDRTFHRLIRSPRISEVANNSHRSSAFTYFSVPEPNSGDFDSNIANFDYDLFHGLVSDDPDKHLKEFHVMCSTMRSHGILEDYIKMKAFPFSMDEAAKDWLYQQPGDMKKVFLEKFFLSSKTTSIRKEICGIT